MACINAVSFRTYPGIEAICRAVRQAGYDALEVSRPHFYETLTTPETRAALARYCASLGLSLRGFDCWVEVEPFTAFAETVREFECACEFAAACKLGLIVSHDSWAHTNGERTAHAVWEANVRLFREVAERAAASGLVLVFEPHPDTLSMDDAWCTEFIDAIAEQSPGAQVGILYDTCHYGVGQPDTYLRAIERLGHRIRHVHFADGDRRTYALHLPVGDGCLDLAAATATLKQIGFRGTLTCDLYNYPLLEDGAARSLDSIRQVEQQLGLSR
ncbi:MAG: sugar phosphate isomerase/epimerase [Pirellulales bacterium]|nr:sugar phosphate isomerase/epimerase [Pirellulales bacterium]